MQLGPTLPRSFFERPCLEVARELLGVLLVRTLPDRTQLVGRLVEVEAYLGDGSDPGSHAHRGPTPRNRSMFGPPGRLYTYRSYGIHTCANAVCESAGSAAGVLLRSVEPLAGIDAMRALRGLGPEQPQRAIAAGPGRLCQAFAIGLAHDGCSALRGEITFRAAPASLRPLKGRCARGPRVGLSKGAELPHRFFVADCPWVSAWRPGKSARKSSRSSARVGK